MSYVIEVKGAGDPGGDNGGTLPDPRVEIHELDWSEQTGWSGALRASNDNASPTNNNARVYYTYPDVDEPQTPIGIRASGASGATGSYTVSVTALPGGIPPVTETADCAEFSFVPGCETTVGREGKGTIDPATDKDTWVVPLEAGKTYNIRVFDAGDGGSETAPNMRAKLYSPQGDKLPVVGLGSTPSTIRLRQAVADDR